MGASNGLSCEAGSFSCCHNPIRFTARGFEPFFSLCWNPGLHGLSHSPVCSSRFIHTRMWGPPLCQAPPCQEFSPPGCPSLPLLQVWMNVSSLTPWLLDFYTVGFSGISGYFLFLNLLLFFIWLWEEVVYLPMPPYWPEVLY